jgi:hypothetical protein
METTSDTLHTLAGEGPMAAPAQPSAADRDYVLGLLLMGVDAIQVEGHDRIAKEMRHLVMTWYTQPGLRRGEGRHGVLRPRTRTGRR